MSPEQKEHNKKVKGKRQPVISYSRVVGYLSPISQWNKGKKEEFRDRKTYKVAP